MKNFIRNSFCLILIPVYLFAYMGFGLHECTAEGTKDLFLLMGDTSCESIHSHSHEHLHKQSGVVHTHAHIYGHHHEAEECHCNCTGHTEYHTANCCETAVYVITDTQNDESDNIAKALISEIIINNNIESPISPSLCYLVQQIISDSPPDESGNSLSYLSVWKL
ncbi:MAG: hypothetical protein M0R23_01535 [Bacteroidales bacterium]|nr:hypothetical protein [Bacteroidales bacterium]